VALEPSDVLTVHARDGETSFRGCWLESEAPSRIDARRASFAVTISPGTVAMLAERVEEAQRHALAIAKLTDEFPDLTIEDGYAVQDELRRRTLARGHRLLGFKAGLTSQAKMSQMGVNAPIVGFLASDGLRAEDSTIPVSELIHPRVEAEIAFVTREALHGPGCDRERVLRATEFVLPALEIIDSRFAGFRFDLPSVIADNTSAARYVIGPRRRGVSDLGLAALGVVLEKNGEVVARAVSAAVLDHPANAVAMIVNHLAARGEELPAGSLVMSGGITEAIAVAGGDCVTARIDELGSVSVRFA
jgi:2-oxo-3-hexenedioate decarboxylase